MAEKDVDLETIKELIEIMKANDLAEVDIQRGENRICLKRSHPPQPTVSIVPAVSVAPGGKLGGAPTAAESAEGRQESKEVLAEIKSPLVGTFYEAASPDSDPYVEVGSHVEPQTVVCIIEAMKVMNEIRAEMGGMVTERLVANGQAVEFGQVLFRVRPD